MCIVSKQLLKPEGIAAKLIKNDTEKILRLKTEIMNMCLKYLAMAGSIYIINK